MGIVINNITNNFISYCNILFGESDLFPDLREKMVLCDNHLLLSIIPISLNSLHAVAQDRINLALVVIAEDE